MIYNHVKLFLFIISLFFVSCLKEGDNKYGTDEGPYAPYFWKVEKDEKTSYFFGTAHAGVNFEDLSCSNEIEEHLKESDYLFTEVDRESKEQEDYDKVTDQIVNELMSKKNGREFKSLNKDSKIFLRSREISEDMNYIGYLGTIQFLCTQSAIFKAGGGAFSLDSYLKAVAQSQNMPIEYLDAGIDAKATAEVVSELLQFSQAVITAQDVDKAILGFEQCILDEMQIFDLYKNSRLPTTSGFSPEQQDTLLRKRNLIWRDKFKKARKKYNHIFLAGGAGHFIFEHNLLDMLKAEGFLIHRMDSSCNF